MNVHRGFVWHVGGVDCMDDTLDAWRMAYAAADRKAVHDQINGDWDRTFKQEYEADPLPPKHFRVMTAVGGLYEGEIVQRAPTASVPPPGHVFVTRSRRVFVVPTVAVLPYTFPHPAPRPSWARRSR